ncbi:MAG: hypothetical protein K0S32_1660, partial [Bacteroidetes bacterium]|nr:hypothetical protein [Bacteroidota bacterium]
NQVRAKKQKIADLKMFKLIFCVLCFFCARLRELREPKNKKLLALNMFKLIFCVLYFFCARLREPSENRETKKPRWYYQQGLNSLCFIRITFSYCSGCGIYQRDQQYQQEPVFLYRMDAKS